jgi:hypothetical protein
MLDIIDVIWNRGSAETQRGFHVCQIILAEALGHVCGLVAVYLIFPENS